MFVRIPQMEPVCYLNGKILPVADACVNVYDIGLLRGFGIYEAFMTYSRKPFMLADHLARFRRSAKAMSLKVPASDEEIRSAVDALVEKSIPSYKEAVIRIILTGGNALDGIEYNYDTPTFYILVEEFKPFPSTLYTDGCPLTVFEQQRQFPESKTTNYIQAVLLQEAREKAGAIEILYVSNGKVLEAATSNFFIVKNGVLITAKSGILEGVTRKVTIEVARPHFSVEIRDVSVDEMYDADEAFITSSFKEIVPIVRVGEKTIGSGKVGDVTKRLMKLFRDYTVHVGR
ncbi:MAG: Aminotransferase class IV [Parcubacteria group bacterium GW2011_GWA2_51_10]|nr:MAG: Aminotransferase class IV [Parcubacteria group bacterium GW2011_GWA2_51_10]